MRMLNQQKINNKIKKSHLLLIGSFLVFIGFLLLFGNYFLRMRNEVYSAMRIAISTIDDSSIVSEELTEVPIANNLPNDSPNFVSETTTESKIDYDKYLAVLEIPKIGLKRGFYNTDSKYNNIQYNVSLVLGSTMPDVVNGNLILMAHSGDAYISYFAYLYRLDVGNFAYITYKGVKYKYQIVNIYNVEKNGSVRIFRNYDRTTLTLITCTKDNDTMQTVYIAELVS